MRFLLIVTLFATFSVTVHAQDDFFEDDFTIGGLDSFVETSENINGELHISGWFTWYNGQVKLNHIAKWNGITWVPFANGLNNSAADFHLHNEELYIGGSFTADGDGNPLNYVAKWNGSSWEPVGNGLNGWVNSLATYQGELYAAGSFSSNYDETEVLSNIAKFDGEQWVSVGFINEEVLDLEIFDEKLIAMGRFSSVRDSLDTFLPENLFNGTYEIEQLTISESVAGNFQGGYLFDDDGFFTIELSNSTVDLFSDSSQREFEANYLSTFGTAPENYILSFRRDSTVTVSESVSSGLTCSGVGLAAGPGVDSLGVFDPSDDSEFTFSLTENIQFDCDLGSQEIMFRATKLTTKQKISDAERALYVAVLDSNGWAPMSLNTLDYSTIDLRDLLAHNNELYLVGNFLTESDTTNVFKWNGTDWQAIPEQPKAEMGYISKALSHDNQLYVLTDLVASRVGGTNGINDGRKVTTVGIWDGTDWSYLEDEVDVFFGFDFNFVGEELFVVGSIRDYDEDIRYATKWDGQKYQPVGAYREGNGILRPQSGQLESIFKDVDETIYTGGNFFSVLKEEQRNMVAINNGEVESIRSLSDKDIDFYNVDNIIRHKEHLFMSGSTFYIDTTSYLRMIAWNTSTDEFFYPEGELDSLSINSIESFTVWDGQLVAGGSFNSTQREDSINNVAIWDDVGKEWKTLGYGFNSRVNTVYTTEDGSLLAGGYFFQSGDSSMIGLAKWVPVDEGKSYWEPMVKPFMVDGIEYVYNDFSVNDIVQFNGDIIVSGYFKSSEDNIGVEGFMRLPSGEQEWEFMGTDYNTKEYYSSVFEVHDGELYAAAKDVVDASTGNDNLIKWNEDSDEWIPVTSGFVNATRGTARIYDLHSTEEGLYIVGAFNEVGGKQSSGIALYTGTKVSNEIVQETPSKIQLLQNYPNPFNPSTNISFNLPQSANVELVVYSVLGQKVVELANERYQAGSHTIQFDASNLASGMYIYQLQVGDQLQTRKMLLIK